MDSVLKRRSGLPATSTSLCLLAVLTLSILPALGSPQASAPASPPQKEYEDVLKLWNAKFSEKFIRNKIAADGSVYHLTADDLITLKTAGVPEGLIEFMLETGRQAKSRQAAPSPAPSPKPEAKAVPVVPVIPAAVPVATPVMAPVATPAATPVATHVVAPVATAAAVPPPLLATPAAPKEMTVSPAAAPGADDAIIPAVTALASPPPKAAAAPETTQEKKVLESPPAPAEPAGQASQSWTDMVLKNSGVVVFKPRWDTGTLSIRDNKIIWADANEEQKNFIVPLSHVREQFLYCLKSGSGQGECFEWGIRTAEETHRFRDVSWAFSATKKPVEIFDFLKALQPNLVSTKFPADKK